MEHFHFSNRFPGQVKVTNEVDGIERIITLLKDPSQTPTPTLGELPDVIVLPGLSLERQWYLYDKILGQQSLSQVNYTQHIMLCRIYLACYSRCLLFHYALTHLLKQCSLVLVTRYANVTLLSC